MSCLSLFPFLTPQRFRKNVSKIRLLVLANTVKNSRLRMMKRSLHWDGLFPFSDTGTLDAETETCFQVCFYCQWAAWSSIWEWTPIVIETQFPHFSRSHLRISYPQCTHSISLINPGIMYLDTNTQYSHMPYIQVRGP